MSAFFLFLFLLVCMAVFPFWNSFYQDCNKIKIGMEREEVQKIMSDYINNKEYFYKSNSQVEFFYNEYGGLMDDYQCDIKMKDEKVINVFPIFD